MGQVPFYAIQLGASPRDFRYAVKWQDMDAVVRLAVKHLSAHSEGAPLPIVGYSNGAALAVNYTLASVDEPDLPRIESLAILSPEIGLTPVAALAIWQAGLGRLLKCCGCDGTRFTPTLRIRYCRFLAWRLRPPYPDYETLGLSNIGQQLLKNRVFAK